MSQLIEKMKYFYVVNHYVPFPLSEYGGLWNVIAKNDDECFDLMVAADVNNHYEKYYSDLKENICNSQTFELADSEESRVVESFTT